MTANSPNFFKQHPVLTHYILTFVISWGGILLAVGPRGIPGIPVQMERMIYRVLLSRLLQWRVGIGWYAVALLITPLLMMDARAQIVLKLYLKNSVLARLVRGRNSYRACPG